jgi:hypothetical protein
LAFAEIFSVTFRTLSEFLKDCDGTTQCELTGAFMQGVVDDCLTSVKLLVAGKMAASGNLARQATEGICMALMTAHDEPLTFGKEDHEYWRLVAGESDKAEGNRAPYQVEANQAKLGLAEAAAAQLMENVKIHHSHSHAGRLAMAFRMDLQTAGKFYFGGHFDPAKIDGYRSELQQRVALCRGAVEMMLHLQPRLAKLPKPGQTLAGAVGSQF